MHVLYWIPLSCAKFPKDASIFEAVHGSAPDIAGMCSVCRILTSLLTIMISTGKGLANPTALLLSSLMMLRYVYVPVWVWLIRLHGCISDT